MRDVLRLLLMLLLAAGLSLPTGWCCWSAVGSGHDQFVATHRCCGDSPAPAQDVPATPERNCCCVADSILSPEITLPSSIAIVSNLDPLAGTEPGASLRRGETLLATTRPPLNVLQCVWRC